MNKAELADYWMDEAKKARRRAFELDAKVEWLESQLLSVADEEDAPEPQRCAWCRHEVSGAE